MDEPAKNRKIQGIAGTDIWPVVLTDFRLMTKLREGEVHLFNVDKKLTTPDKNKYFVLAGPGERKFLLPAKTYSHYDIKVGNRIKCRVDKINCNGEIFLEPENPYYREGEYYLFDVVETALRTDVSGNDIGMLVVKDCFANRIFIPAGDDNPAPGTKVKLRVDRISKGRLFLYPYGRKHSHLKLRAGRYYEFLVEKITSGLDDLDYFVIRDPAGDRHLLPKAYYEYYGIRPGQKLRGKVVKYSSNGEKIIEPENPYYKPGTFIRLKVVYTERNSVNSLFTVGLEDKLGFTHCIETPTPPQKETVRCRITRIKKGRPLLEPV